jgi:ribonuclease-3 family protein
MSRFSMHDAISDDNVDSLHNLHRLLLPSDKCQVDQMSSTDLAYVGDAVYELLIRTTKVWPSKRTSDLQSQVVSIVRGTSLRLSSWGFFVYLIKLTCDIAEYQADLLKALKESFELTDKEYQILNRGRNSVSRSNRRDPAAYQDATALEALIGYLYITDTPRCSQLLGWIQNTIDSDELS